MKTLALSIGLIFILGLMAVLLPSCGGEYPLKGSISYRDPQSGAKAGLVFAPGEPVRARMAHGRSSPAILEPPTSNAMQTALIILFVILALCLVLAAAVSLLCGEVRTLKDEADEKDAELIRDIEKWRSGK